MRYAKRSARRRGRTRALPVPHERRRLDPLEPRILLSAGEWLTQFTGVPGVTRDVQLAYIQGLFHTAGFDQIGIKAIEHVGVDGTVIVTSPSFLEADALRADLDHIPGFSSMEPWDDATPPAQRHIYVPESPGNEGDGSASASTSGTPGPAPQDALTAGPAIVQSVTGFNGINDSQTAALSPPDSDGAVGPSSFVEAVNTALAIYNKTTGATISGGAVTQFSTFFSPLGGTLSFSDPVVVYNDITQKFFVGILDFDNTSNCRLDVAISKTNNPTLAAADWNMFRFNTNDGIGASFDFSDYPKIGYNADGYVVSFNMFPNLGSFDHVSVLGISNSGTGTGMRVMPGGFTNFTIAPASEHGAAPGAPMWFVTDGHSAGGGSSISVLRLDNPFSTASVVVSTFSIAVPTYNNAPNPRQPGSSLGTSTSLGTRFYFSALRTVSGVTYLASAHAVGNATGVESRWYQFDVTSGTPTLLQRGTVNPNPSTTDTYFPAVDIAPDGTIGMNYSESGASEYMSMYVTGHKPSDAAGAMETPVLAKTNAVALNAFNRAGDYSFTSVDPVDGTFWAVNEYAGNNASPNWATWIQHFSLGGLSVSSSTPAAGAVIAAPTSTFIIAFSDAIDPTSLQPSDLTVNSLPATSVSLSADDKTATFAFASSPVTTQGLQSMAIAAGAVTRLGDPSTTLAAFSASFRYDAVVLQVTSANPPSGTSLTAPGAFTLDLNFNEPVDPASVQTSDLVLSGIASATVSGVTVLAGNTTAEFTISGITNDGAFSASLAAGAITDQYGNPGLSFSANYFMDIAVRALPAPAPMLPLGSLIYQSTVSGSILTSSDVDSLTVNLDPGQTLTVAVSGSASLRPSLMVTDPSWNVIGSATASAAGQPLLLETLPVATAGTYTITLADAAGATGTYTLTATLNAAVDTGLYGGPTNQSLATAQDLAGSIVSLPASTSRAAVLGQILGANNYAAAAVGFSFEDISTTGTTITALTGADDGSTSIPIGFSFPLYGTTYSTVFVSSNGLLTFGSSNIEFSNADLTSDPTQATIAPFWDDLIVSGGSNSSVRYQVLGSGSNQHLTIDWNQVSFFGTGTSGDTLTFEAQLYVDGRIRFNYLDLISGSAAGNNGASATVGIKDAGTQGLSRLLLAFNNGPNTYVGASRSTLLSPPLPSANYYQFTLHAGDVVTAGLKNTAGPGATLALLNSAGSTLAGGVSAANLDQVISQVTASAAGTYYLKVAGFRGAAYDLLLTENAAFDTELNDTFATAQNVSGARAVLGDLNGLITTGNIGYYTDNNTGSTGPAAAITLAGFSPVQISDISSFNLSSIDVLMVDESSNTGLSSAMTGRLAAIQAWVQSGGIFIVHDRFVAASTTPASNPFLLGASGAMAVRDLTYSTDLNVVPPGGTLVTNGPFGVITDASLDGGTSSDHGWVQGATLPAGATAILSAGPAANVAAFSYPLGSGTVYYSTIPLDYYLDGNGPNPPANNMRTVYTPNALTYVENSRTSSQQDWYSLNVTSTSVFLHVDTSTPADGPGQFVNTLNPHIQLYDPSGALVATGVALADGRNESLDYAPLVTGAYRIRVSNEGGTTGEYVLNMVSRSLFLTVPSDALETAGALNGTLFVPTAPASDLLVALTSGDPGRVSVPATITVPAGQTSVPVPLTVIDNNLLDGPEQVTIAANAAGYNSSSAAITVHDNETATLTITLLATTQEGAGTIAGTVTSSAPPTRDIVVQLTSGTPSRLTVPATVTIPAGQTTVNFSATVVDNTVIDFTQNVAVSAAVENWTGGGATVAVADNDNFVAVTLPAGGWEGQTLVNAGTVTIGGTMATPLTVNLSSSDTTALTVPASVTVPAGQTSAAFNLTFITDGVKAGSRTAGVTATAGGLTTGNASLTVHDRDLDHLAIDPISSPQTDGAAFAATVRAYNVTNEVIAVYGAAGTLGAAGQAGVLPVNPTAITFASGTWTGNVTVNAADPAATLTATSGGISTTSNTFALQAGPMASLQWNPVVSPQVQNAPFPMTLTARDVNGFLASGFSGNVSLTGFAVTSLNSRTIFNGNTTFTAFNINTFTYGYAFTPTSPAQVTAVRSFWGAKVSIWTDTGTLLVSQTVTGTPGAWTETALAGPVTLLAGTRYRIAAYVSSGSYYWRDTAPAFSWGAINGAYFTGSDAFPAQSSTGIPLVDLRANVSTIGPVPFAPTSASFVGGLWSGNVTSPLPESGLYVEANDGSGHVADSSAFDVLPAAPSAPDLLPVSDTGVSIIDNITHLNNAAPGSALQFSVGGTFAGANVTLYSGNTLIGSAIAGATSTLIITDGLTRLSDGMQPITARQTVGTLQSPVSPALQVTIDSVAPVVTAGALTTFDTTPPLSGAVDDPAAAVAVTVSGNTYNAVNNGDGTWSLPDNTITPALAPAVYDFTATATDIAGNSATANAALWIPPATFAVSGRHVFYKGSTFYDSVGDNQAIPTDKSALLPGQTAAFANYTSYDRGINGLLVDLNGPITSLSAADFTFKVGGASPTDLDPTNWVTAPAPLSVTWSIVPGTTRIEIVWPDSAIRNQWLQVTVLADAHTNLAANDVFYFGNAVGETGNSAADAKVTVADILAARANPRTIANPAPIDSPYDFNRDGSVDAVDVGIAGSSLTSFANALVLISAPMPPSAPPSVSTLSQPATVSPDQVTAAAVALPTADVSVVQPAPLTVPAPLAAKGVAPLLVFSATRPTAATLMLLTAARISSITLPATAVLPPIRLLKMLRGLGHGRPVAHGVQGLELLRLSQPTAH